jgi:hypothetical protein
LEINQKRNFLLPLESFHCKENFKTKSQRIIGVFNDEIDGDIIIHASAAIGNHNAIFNFRKEVLVTEKKKSSKSLYKTMEYKHSSNV